MRFQRKIYSLPQYFRILLYIVILLLTTFPIIFLSTCTKKYDLIDDFSPQEKESVGERDNYSFNSDTSGEWEESEQNQPGKDDRSKKEWKSDNDPNKPENQEEPDERMKVYFGFLHLRVDNINESRSVISSLADETGGYVETSYENTIIIRVPKELFTDILAKLMNMGEVLNKSIETYDVTDFFQDLTARLEIARKTRDRLYNLLEKTKDVKERLKILKEIRRLSEEIENISLTLENIKRLISFSRITIKLEQRLTELSNEDRHNIPFPWIASLDPFYISLSTLEGKVKMDIGEEFAVFDNKKYFFAESTQGVRLHIASTPNTPLGEVLFWQKAIDYHLSRFYKNSQLMDLGNFKAVQFMSKDAKPFYYFVGVFVKRKYIFVCEVLFPNQAAFDDLGETVKNYLSKCEIY